MVIIEYFLFLFYPDIFIPPPALHPTTTNTDRLIFTKVFQNVRLKGTKIQTFRGCSLFLSGGFKATKFAWLWGYERGAPLQLMRKRS